MEHSEVMDKVMNEVDKYDISFAEARIYHLTDENILVRNGQIDRATKNSDRGLNVSVIKDGARGFAMTYNFDNIAQLVENAVKVAKASVKKKRKNIELTDEPVIVDTYKTPYKIDTFEVPFEEKLELLLHSDSILRENGQIKVAQSSIDTRRVKYTSATRKVPRYTRNNYTLVPLLTQQLSELRSRKGHIMITKCEVLNSSRNLILKWRQKKLLMKLYH
jgi:predicted Zn-dependent protease